MTFEELLERLDDYFAGELPLEDVQRLEEQISRDPLLAMATGLHLLEPLAGDQIAASILPMETTSQQEHPRFPRLWLLSLLAGSVVVGAVGGRRKTAPSSASARTTDAEGAASPGENAPPGPA